MEEEWRAVPGHPNHRVSSEGRVWSGLKGPGRILRSAVDQYGYPIVSLWDPVERRGQSRRVHILMLEAFVGPRPPGAVIRHLDSDPANCVLTNLAYGTHSENGLDAVRNGTHVQASKTHCPLGHPFSPTNTYIRRDRPNRRECRACRRIASAKRAKKRGEDNRLG